MAKEKQTTVNLNERAQTIKEDLAPVFGLKNILSAGLILFGRLNSDDQKKAIKDANSNGNESPGDFVDGVIADAKHLASRKGKSGRREA